ncbi:MAG: response regulator [Marinomonas atlantica]|nr:response regulator [Marinomonas atlantica]
MYLLLVEDDLGLGNVLLKILSRTYRVDWVRNLASAKSHFQAAQYDLILLDLGLPDGDGIDWLLQLRQENADQPILILSARDGLDDRVQGLDTGADDYLVKPFEPEELQARIRVLLRRHQGRQQEICEYGDLSYDQKLDQFYLNGDALNLPHKEAQLLLMLLQSVGNKVHRERLLQRIYGLANDSESNTLDVHIYALRKIIGKERIETVRGFGYRLVKR